MTDFVSRITDVLDAAGVPRHEPGGPPDAAMPLTVEARVMWLAASFSFLRSADIRTLAKDCHRRVPYTVRVRTQDLTEAEKSTAQQRQDDGTWIVRRWDDSEAVKIVKRTFGADVDISDGTVGDAFVRLVEKELKHLDVLREKLVALATTIRQP